MTKKMNEKNLFDHWRLLWILFEIRDEVQEIMNERLKRLGYL